MCLIVGMPEQTASLSGSSMSEWFSSLLLFFREEAIAMPQPFSTGCLAQVHVLFSMSLLISGSRRDGLWSRKVRAHQISSGLERLLYVICPAYASKCNENNLKSICFFVEHWKNGTGERSVAMQC